MLRSVSEELLDTYEEERLPIAAWLLGVTTKLHQQGFRGNGSESRDPETLQLLLNYRCSSLAREERDRPGSIRAGDRAPDAPCLDGAGAGVRLFDLFRGPHFTLLAFGAAHADTITRVNVRYDPLIHAYVVVRPGEKDGDHAIVDYGGHARTGYDIADDALVLIRPDGYIGLFACPGALDELVEYLQLKYAQAIRAVPL